MLYKGDDLRLTICAYYSWKVTLNVNLGVSFDITENWEGIREKVGEADITKAYV
jgi:hypothetical protein